jgi:tetratricopeptide (TPR) repeat protein
VKQQIFIITGSIALLFSLFFFSRTIPHSKGNIPAEKETVNPVITFDLLLEKAKQSVDKQQLTKLITLENTISRGDLKNQKLQQYEALSLYWKDSIQNRIPYLFYQSEKAKLENSEKSLNFAAQTYLSELQSEQEPAMKSWMANQAKELFDLVLAINPGNDSAKVGWGSTFIFGASGTSSPMEGILKIREVAQKDSTNMYAQFMLGYGGMLTGQFDKAIDRLNRVVKSQPANLEAIFLLAEAYERSNQTADAKKWYLKGKNFVTNPELIKAIDEKIKNLN